MSQPGTSPQPHDRFFKVIFSETERAAGFLRGALPAELLEQLDLSSLQLDPNSYIDEQLRETFADLVYHCRFRQRDLKLVFLLEHKSYVPAYPHLQLLRYLLNLWERQAKDKEALSPVIPIVIYHGGQAWHYRPFEAYLPGGDDPLLLPYLPRFDFMLANLQAQSSEALQARFDDLIVQRALMLMKTVFEKALIDRLDPIFQGLGRALDIQQGQELIRKFTLYLYAVVDTHEKDAVMKKVQDLTKDFPYYENSILASLIEEGRLEGKEEGRLEGRLEGKLEGKLEGRLEGRLEGKLEGKEEGREEAIAQLLKHGMPPVQVASILELPLERIEAVQRRLAGEA